MKTIKKALPLVLCAAFAVCLLPAAPAPVAGPSRSGSDEVLERVRLTPIRRTIGARLLESHTQKPTAALTTTVDATSLLALRARFLERTGQKLSVDAILARTVAGVLRSHRAINARLEGDEMMLLRDINIGVAVDTPKGLLVPVLRRADEKSLGELSEELAALSARAKDGQATAEELSGGTFTVTNLGMFGVEQFTPVINPPECCILAVGAIKPVFVPDERDRPVLKKTFQMTLVFDHRMVDGAPAARFLGQMRACLELPELLL